MVTAAVLACGGSPPVDRAADSAPPPAESVLSDSVPILVLEQEGGIAGATSELTLFRTGEATLAQAPAPGGIPVRRWTLAQPDYDAIATLLESAAFRALDAEYLPENTCCDRITYTIRVPTIDGERTIRTMDAAQQPDALADLLERLRALEATAPQ
jgi:hypothetical protein